MSTAPATVLQALRSGDVVSDVLPESATSTIKGVLRIHYPEYTVSEGEAIPRAATLKQPDLELPNAVSVLGQGRGNSPDPLSNLRGCLCCSLLKP